MEPEHWKNKVAVVKYDGASDSLAKALELCDGLDGLKANDKVLVGFLRAVYKAQDWLNNPKNKKEAVDLMVDLSKAHRSSVERTYDKYTTELKVYNRGAITADVIKRTLQDMVEIDAISKPIPDPNKLLDLSYRQKALAK